MLTTSGARASYYTLAVLTGLRVSEMAALRWADVNTAEKSLIVRAEICKSGRTDAISMTDQAAEEFEKLRPSGDCDELRVFESIPSLRTFRKDLKTAGIPYIDAAGRIVDRHALRTTAGTLLARSGVSPQIAQSQLRHASVTTTMNHYTDLNLRDQAREVARVPRLGDATAKAVRRAQVDSSDPQQICQQSVHDSGQECATPNAQMPTAFQRDNESKHDGKSCPDKASQLRARPDRKAGDRDRTGDIQLGNARAPDRNPRESGHFRRAARPLAHALAHGPRPDGNSGPAPVPPRSPTSRPARRWPRSPDVANRRAVGPTWRDVGVYASTHTESATMPPWAGIL